MPRAGDEGYEEYVVCPYDKSHEIRKGRMQFHIEKCRKNFPNTKLAECPFNKMHLVRAEELTYHIEEECTCKNNWDRYTHEKETTKYDCPVKDLVPVNAGSLPECEENWDDCVVDRSPLDIIREEAEKKPIVRMKQVASKAERKAFRKNERLRWQEMEHGPAPANINPEPFSDTASVASGPSFPALKPQSRSKVPHQIERNRLAAAQELVEQHNQQMSRTISSVNGNEMTAPEQQPFSYAAASRGSAASTRPGSAMSSFSTDTFGTAYPSSSIASEDSFASALYRPQNSRLNTSSSFHTARPASGWSNSSYASAPQDAPEMIPIPGLGRGRGTQGHNFCPIPIPGKPMSRGRGRPQAN